MNDSGVGGDDNRRFVNARPPRGELEIGRTEKISLRKTTYTKRLTPPRAPQGRVARSHVSSAPPLIELDVRISRIQLSDHLLPAACAASQADGSLFLPFGTADTVYTGTDSSSASEPTANCIGVCVGAITAARSARPNQSGERSGCCCQPGNRYTTHSESDSASESPPRPRRYWETIGPPGVPDPGYVGTPSCAATCTATVSGVFGTQNQETRNPLPPS